MRKTNALALAALGTALAMSLAACGGTAGGGGDKTTGTGNTGTGASAAKHNDGYTKVVNANDAKGGTLKFAYSDEPDSMDPGNTYYAFNWNFTRLYARPLLTYTAAPGEEGLKLVPDLAEGLGEASEDGKTWTYKIKKGIKYDDGTEVKAADVKYAIARSNFSEELTDGPKYFAEYLDAEGYKGPYKDKNLDNFKAIETPDDYTIVFKLKAPFSEFDFLVANPQSAPVPQAKDTGLEYEKTVASTGPYKIESYEVGKQFNLVKNEHWDQATDTTRKQLPDRIEVQMKQSAEDIDQRLLAGQIHVDLGGTGVQTAARAKIVGDAKLKDSTDNPYTPFNRYAMMSTKVAPFDNIECRKAVQYATDQVATQAPWGGPLGGDIGSTLMTPTTVGYQQYDLFPNGADNKGDVAKAKEALAACGKADGFETNIAVRGDRTKEVQVAEALQASLDKVGIKASIKKYPSGDWSAQYAGKPDFVHKNNLGIMIAGWGADWPSGFGFLSQIVDGRFIKASGNYNMMELNDPAVNELLDKGIQTTDATERNKIWGEVDKKVMESAAFLPFVYEKTLLFRPESLTNVYVHPAYGMYDYTWLGVKQ
ncbi:ABC transporter substrate-binding protein [Planomonospora venezuelensis]|uniref:Peptide/nickel transport system substrate-binding protein n=1 Tax=Planomonospora venezuelensis TaxID=1999 RepID=A0A841D548_PLAVE|nr:ABC transporter substrate-binding protein [Planomonospora venezuelensis]MBB5963285.1 peptide/nickel transport system substrate-binding protein [Planomonospora venezuelensis]GIN02690.1 peptide ABC transporter substrate-binding protein [Planomonospora venezuelensis]